MSSVVSGAGSSGGKSGSHSAHSGLVSMTGYATRSFAIEGMRYKIEIKTLNHRFIEMKLRTPREWMSLESQIRSWVESKIKRGSVEIWIEKIPDGSQNAAVSEASIHFGQAEAAFKQMNELRRRLKLEEPITLRDLLTYPEVLTKGSAVVLNDEQVSDLTEVLQEQVQATLQDLVAMRTAEGTKLQKALLQILSSMKSAHERLVQSRAQIQKRIQEKIKRKIEQCFEAYATPDAQMRALMETRVAQEIAYVLEKSDIEEELTRFRGHLDAVEKLLREGGSVGKKLDFLFQELNREINTLGNKSQDLDVSGEVIQMKTAIEQLREQSLNIE
jgi:uncharacterized protein (TIGR00255 family)